MSDLPEFDLSQPYLVVERIAATHTASGVSFLIGEGYRPHGSMLFARDMFIQPMVRPAPQPPLAVMVSQDESGSPVTIQGATATGAIETARSHEDLERTDRYQDPDDD